MKLILLLSIVCISLAAAVPLRYEQVIQAVPQDASQLQALRQLMKTPEVEFLTEPMGEARSVLIKTLPESSILVWNTLNKANINANVTIPNLRQYLKEERAGLGVTDWDYTSYHSLSQIYGHLEKLANETKNTELITLGKTHEGRQLKAIRIGKGKDVVLMECGVHAREWISPAICVYMAEQLIRNPIDDNSDILKKYNVVIIPVYNPDGYEYSQRGPVERTWRKNRRPQSKSCIGVDLNRNTDVKHEEWEDRWRVGCRDDSYPGATPFSELETQALRKYALSLGSSLKVYLALHSYGQLWMYPYAYTTSLPPNYDDLVCIGKLGVNALAQKYGTRYQLGQVSRLVGIAVGSTLDWIYINTPAKMSYALELRDKGGYGFLLPASQIIPTAEEAWAGIQAILLSSGAC